jgi:hypothetical protein
MEQSQLNWIANFIWGIADDVLRDLYVRGKYRDIIPPMTVLRRLNAVLDPRRHPGAGKGNRGAARRNCRREGLTRQKCAPEHPCKSRNEVPRLHP